MRLPLERVITTPTGEDCVVTLLHLSMSAGEQLGVESEDVLCFQVSDGTFLCTRFPDDWFTLDPTSLWEACRSELERQRGRH